MVLQGVFCMVWKKATPLGYQLHLIVQFHLLRKCGLLAHTSAAFLKNCCTEKLFICASHDAVPVIFAFSVFTFFPSHGILKRKSIQIGGTTLCLQPSKVWGYSG
jgi:hypothetical protein